jgi:type II secretory pathway component PulC
MSDSPTNEPLHQGLSKGRGSGFMVFFLGFLAGFLVALVVAEKGFKLGKKEETASRPAEVAPESATEPASEAAGLESHATENEHGVKEPEKTREDEAPPQHDMVITKAMRDRMLTIDFLDLLQDAELHRYRFEGETKGVKLSKIRTGSIYQKAGFKDGDIIEQINGIAVADLERKPAKARQELPAANKVTFKVRRDDKVMTIRVRVAGFHAD